MTEQGTKQRSLIFSTKYFAQQMQEKYSDIIIPDTASNKEDYIMTKLGYCKVYRTGNTKWEKKYY